MASSVFLWPGMFASNGSQTIFVQPVAFAPGTVLLPGATFPGDPDTGLSWLGGGTLIISNDGVAVQNWSPTGITLRNSAGYQWAAGDPAAGGPDTGLYRDAIGVIAQRFGTDNQTLILGASGTTSRLALNVGTGTTTGANSLNLFTKTVTGIADNTATAVLTVTIPNANHAAALRLLFLSSNGGADAYESSRSAQGLVVFARTTGVNAVATAAAIADGVIATVAAGATHTLAYAVSAVAGAVGAVNTFTITVTIDDSGNLGANQCVVCAELVNAAASGITVA